MSGKTFRHRSTCTDPGRMKEFTGKHGDVMLLCRDCLAVAPKSEPKPAVSPDAEMTLPALVRMVCGHHLNQPVDGRGRGCPRCAAERRFRR